MASGTRGLMKALVYADRGIQLEWIDIPEIAPGEVLVELDSIGVCGSEYGFLEGKEDHRHIIGSVGGHEGGGRVIKLGDDVKNLNIGDVVAIESHHDKPGFEVGRDPKAAIIGYRAGTDRVVPQGTWAEYIAVPAHLAFRIPEDLAKVWPLSLWEPTGNSVRLYNFVKECMGEERGGLVVVSGLGPQGIMISAILKHYCGIDNTVGIEVDPRRREFARKLGVVGKVCTPGEIEREGLQADYWIETSGVQPAVSQAFKGTKQGGYVLLFGLNHGKDKYDIQLDDRRHELNSFVLSQGNGKKDGREVIGVCGRHNDDWEEAPEIIRTLAGKMKMSELYTLVGCIECLPKILQRPGIYPARAMSYMRHNSILAPGVFLKSSFTGFS